jgi:tRNA1(Val) A37 N6-methylase TrmN6
MATNCAMNAEAPALGEIGEDRLLGGRLRLLQPVKGHRAGSDAVLLAAAIPELGEGRLVDFGAGVGTIGLAVALRQPTLEVVLVERDPELAALAARNAGLNDLAGRVRAVVGTIGERNGDLAREGLVAGSAAWVAMNPPFFDAGEVRASPVANRRAAHVAGQSLGDWLKAVRHVLKPGGGISIIHRAEALGAILSGLETGFGAVEIRPIHSQPDRPAIRVIVSARLGSKKPAALLPALVLNDTDGRFTAVSEALHRGEAVLA